MREATRLLGPALALSLAACTASPDRADRPLPQTGHEPAPIVPAELLADASALSADALEGRAPGSEGDRRAREILARRLAEAGAEPAFDGSFEQRFEIVGVTTRLPVRWTFRAADGGDASFRLRDDFIGASGSPAPDVSIADAEVVFAGYGIQAPEQRWDGPFTSRPRSPEMSSPASAG